MGFVPDGFDLAEPHDCLLPDAVLAAELAFLNEPLLATSLTSSASRKSSWKERYDKIILFLSE